MRSRAIRSETIQALQPIQGTDDKTLVLAVQGQPEDRPYPVGEPFRPKPVINEDAAAEGHALVELHVHRYRDGRAEQRFALTERIEELGVVAVERGVGPKRHALLRGEQVTQQAPDDQNCGGHRKDGPRHASRDYTRSGIRAILRVAE